MAEQTQLYDVNLLGLDAQQLQGPWRLVHLRSSPGAELPWAEATHLQLHEGTFALRGPASPLQEGTWHLQRHARLGQPFLMLLLPGAPAQALVTRLRCSPDGAVRQMVLYFQSGLELQLTHP